jgi:hypothetical protein
VNLAPILAPLFPFLGAAAAGEGRGMGGLAIFIVFGTWSIGGSLLVLLLNATLLLRRRQTLGLAYFQLAAEGDRPGRMLLAEGLIWLAFPLLGWFASLFSSDAETRSCVLESVLLASWLGNWLFWLAPSRRTLADRLGGCRIVVARPDPTHAMKAGFGGPVWPEVVLLGPPLLLMPWYGQIRGAAAGGLVALLVMAAPVALKRLRK